MSCGITRAVIVLFSAVLVFSVQSKRLAAESNNTEELAFMEMGDVFAAAKHLQEVRDAPASVTIVTDEDIQKYGYGNLAEVIENTRSFYVSSDRMYDYIGFRGIARLGDHGNIFLELVDGHTVNDNIYGSVFLGNDFGIDMDLVKKVEIVRGPGSALFGSNALLGILNVVAKGGEDIDGLYAKTEIGSFDSFKGSLIYGNKFDNGMDIVASASAMDAGGQDLHFKEFDRPPSNGTAEDADGETAFSGFLKTTYREFTLTANAHLREKHVPTAPYGTDFGDNRFKATDIRSFIEAKWDHPMEKGREFFARAYLDQYYYRGEYPYSGAMNEDRSNGYWLGTELKHLWKVGNSHVLTVGGEAVEHMRADQKNLDLTPREVTLDDRRDFTSLSGYAQDEWDIAAWLRLTAGARFDYFTHFGQHLSPRVGVIAKPIEEGALKLLYGQSFRIPSLFELYYDDQGSTARKNPALEPETLNAYEVVWEQDFHAAFKGTATAFHYDIKNLIAPVGLPEEVVQYRNIKDAESNGIELGVEADWPGLFRGGLSYTIQQTEDNATGKELPNSPNHLVKARVVVPIYKDRIFFAVLCRYMSERLTRSGHSVDDALITDLNVLGLNLYKRLSLSFGAQNIFDVDYSYPVSPDLKPESIKQDGRSFRFKVSYLY